MRSVLAQSIHASTPAAEPAKDDWLRERVERDPAAAVCVVGNQRDAARSKRWVEAAIREVSGDRELIGDVADGEDAPVLADRRCRRGR